MNLLWSVLFLLGVTFVNVKAKPQVPYDYIPIGRSARVQELSGHPSDMVLNYERLFPARRKWVDHNYKFRRFNSEAVDEDDK